MMYSVNKEMATVESDNPTAASFEFRNGKTAGKQKQQKQPKQQPTDSSMEQE